MYYIYQHIRNVWSMQKENHSHTIHIPVVYNITLAGYTLTSNNYAVNCNYTCKFITNTPRYITHDISENHMYHTKPCHLTTQYGDVD
jgi:hypothetical protein